MSDRTRRSVKGEGQRPRLSDPASRGIWVPLPFSTGSLLSSLGPSPAPTPLPSASYLYLQCLEDVILSGEGCELLWEQGEVFWG